MARRALLGWRCSSCGELITKIEDGWVEWLASDDDQGTANLRSLRLVHRWVVDSGSSARRYCRFDDRREFQKDRSIVEGLSLERFVGPDGLMLLLSFVADGEMPTDDILELTKRVQIPGYEQVRELIHDASTAGVIVPVIAERYYIQSEIQELLRWDVNEIKPENPAA
jgi:hypothetical protein